MNSHQEHNRRAWDAMVRQRDRFAKPVDDAEFTKLRQELLDTPWIQQGGLRGKQVLCLAAGGGRQGPIYASLGAAVTVVDISPAQLALDREVAVERGLNLRTVQASMDDLSMFDDAQFEVVVQPVSSCYIPDLRPMYREIARVTPVGAIYVSQHKQPASLQTSERPGASGYVLDSAYYHQGELPPVSSGSRHRECGTLEYLHRWETLIGEMCRAGFVIEDLLEPTHADVSQPPGSFAHRSHFVAPYVRIRARRIATAGSANARPRIVMP